MRHRVGMLGVGLLAATVGWPDLVAAQPRTAAEVQAICVKETQTKASHYSSSPEDAAALRRVAVSCCQEMSAKAAALSPIQRGIIWMELDQSILLMTHRGGYGAADQALVQFQSQIPIPQRTAAKKLIVERLRCQKNGGYRRR